MKWALWGDGLVGGRGRGCLGILILESDDLFIEHWPSRIYTQWPDIGYIYIWIYESYCHAKDPENKWSGKSSS
jgi:hypothetical protein